MKLIRTLGVDRKVVTGERYTLAHNDCVLELADWEDDVVDLICTSIPFGTQYEYCPSLHDFGHNADNAAFFEQMDFLVPELLRVLRPGRIAAIHVKDRIQFGNVTGFAVPTVEPFSDHTTTVFTRHGFKLLARITIDTDVVRENAQTYRLSWSEVCKDSTKMGAGMPEYVLIFRKLPTELDNAYADVRVPREKKEWDGEARQWTNAGGYSRGHWQIDASGLWRSSGNRLPDPEVMRTMNMADLKRLWIEHCTKGVYDYAAHVALNDAMEKAGKLPGSFTLFPAVSRHPDVWTDIVRMRTLNTQQAARNEEKHVCPLQLDIIERLIGRYCAAGEVVYDPFAGIGSVPYQALKMGRRAVGTELNEEYWRFAVGFCEAVEAEMDVPTLFDLDGVVPVVAR